MADPNGSMNGSGSAQGGGGKYGPSPNDPGPVAGAYQPPGYGPNPGNPTGMIEPGVMPGMGRYESYWDPVTGTVRERSAGGGSDTSASTYQKTQGTPQPGGNTGMVADTGGNVISDPVEDPNTYTPTRYPKDPYGGPSGIPIHTPPGDPGAGQSAGLPPTFPPAQPSAAPTPYDLYLSRGGRPLTDAQQAAAAQAQQALGADYSHLSNPYANIAGLVQRGTTPDQIAQAVRQSYSGVPGGGSGYDLSASHDGGQSAFNALRGGPVLGIADNGTPQQVAAWRARVENNPLMAIPNRMRGSNLSVPNGGAPGEDIPNRPGTQLPPGTTTAPSGVGGRTGRPTWDPGGGTQVGPGGTTGAGDPAGTTTPTNLPWQPYVPPGTGTTAPGYAGAGAAQGTPMSATPGKGGAGAAYQPYNGAKPGGGNGTQGYGYGGPATPGPSGPSGGQNEGGVPRTGGGGGYRPGGGQDVPETSSTAGGGGYGYEETTTKKWSPSGGSGGRGASAQRPAAQYPWRGGQLS